MEVLVKYLKVRPKIETLIKESGYVSTSQKMFRVSHEPRTRIWLLMRRLYRRRTSLKEISRVLYAFKLLGINKVLINKGDKNLKNLTKIFRHKNLAIFSAIEIHDFEGLRLIVLDTVSISSHGKKSVCFWLLSLGAYFKKSVCGFLFFYVLICGVLLVCWHGLSPKSQEK